MDSFKNNLDKALSEFKQSIPKQIETYIKNQNKDIAAEINALEKEIEFTYDYIHVLETKLRNTNNEDLELYHRIWSSKEYQQQKQTELKAKQLELQQIK